MKGLGRGRMASTREQQCLIFYNMRILLGHVCSFPELVVVLQPTGRRGHQCRRRHGGRRRHQVFMILAGTRIRDWNSYTVTRALNPGRCSSNKKLKNHITLIRNCFFSCIIRGCHERKNARLVQNIDVKHTNIPRETISLVWGRRCSRQMYSNFEHSKLRSQSSSSSQQVLTHGKFDHFWTNYGPFLDIFFSRKFRTVLGTILVQFWDHFGAVLRSFQALLGTVLGSFAEIQSSLQQKPTGFCPLFLSSSISLTLAVARTQNIKSIYRNSRPEPWLSYLHVC